MKSFSITSVFFVRNLHIYFLCMKHIFLVKPILAGLDIPDMSYNYLNNLLVFNGCSLGSVWQIFFGSYLMGTICMALPHTA